MEELKFSIENYGRYGGTNYFIIPKIYNMESYVQIFRDFQDAFGRFKNQTIHVFAAFEWKELKMLETCTVKQVTNMDDDEPESEELRHFHYIQWFLYYLQSQEISRYNKIIFHCNRYPLKLKKGLSKYLFIQSSTPHLFKNKIKIRLVTDKYNSFWFRMSDHMRIFFISNCIITGTVKHTWGAIKADNETSYLKLKYLNNIEAIKREV